MGFRQQPMTISGPEEDESSICLADLLGGNSRSFPLPSSSSTTRNSLLDSTSRPTATRATQRVLRWTRCGQLSDLRLQLETVGSTTILTILEACSDSTTNTFDTGQKEGEQPPLNRNYPLQPHHTETTVLILCLSLSLQRKQ